MRKGRGYFYIGALALGTMVAEPAWAWMGQLDRTMATAGLGAVALPLQVTVGLALLALPVAIFKHRAHRLP